MHIQFLCLVNISKAFAFGNMKEPGLYCYVFDFFVEYETIDSDDFVDIHEYLVK